MKQFFVFLAVVVLTAETVSSQNVGIGTTTPLVPFHIYNGSSGNPTPFGPLLVEGNNNTYINILTPNIRETGILFGKADNAASGAIIYNNVNALNGFQFRTNGNITQMILNSAGNLGIGLATPSAKLSVSTTGTELAGTTASNALRTLSGTLGNAVGNELSIASIGFSSSNNSSLGIRAYRNIAGTDWTSTALLLEYDVDNTTRAGGSFLALSAYGNIGINTVSPHPSSLVDMSSTTKGMLPPRMTTAQRDAIPNPVPGLMLFNSTSQSLEVYTTYGWYGLHLEIPERKLLGGIGDDIPVTIQQTTDGGYIVACNSFSSADGDVTGVNHGNQDCWIVKLDANRNITWNKLLGGNNDDWVKCIQQTADGGYIFAGYSISSANGDVSQTSHGGFDYWVVKLNSLGIIEWDKLLGGSNSDKAQSIRQTPDGDYIIAGYSLSSNSGDVTQTTHGITDYWIVKLNSTGNILWQKLLGGTGNEIPYDIAIHADGSYVIAGESTSSANGDVTGVNHGAAGTTDYWIVRLNNLDGNIIWNKLLGGSGEETAQSIQAPTGDGYIIAGHSTSSANGNVTGTTHSPGNNDLWIVRLDRFGNITWNKLIGGNNDDQAYSIKQTTDGGFIVAGDSRSSSGGDISASNHGGISDYLLFRLDGTGNILWNRLFGGIDIDHAYSVIQTADGGYAIAGSTRSSFSGDVNSGNHNPSLFDCWIIKVGSTGYLY
jgi:hypothetical protein